MILVPVVSDGAQSGADFMCVPIGPGGAGIPTVADAGTPVRRAGVTWASASRCRPRAGIRRCSPRACVPGIHVAPAGLQRTGSVEEILVLRGSTRTSVGHGARLRSEGPAHSLGDPKSTRVVLREGAEPLWGQRGSVRALLAAGKQGKGLLTKPPFTW